MQFTFDNLLFRRTLGSELGFVSELEANSENSSFITSWPRERHMSALKNRDLFHGLILRKDEAVGFFILAGLENPNESIEFMRIVICEKGKGLGRVALKAIKAYCFERLGAHRIWLDVKTFNTRAQHLYQSEGFVLEGTLRECLKAGEKFESLHLLSILAGEHKRS